MKASYPEIPFVVSIAVDFEDGKPQTKHGVLKVYVQKEHLSSLYNANLSELNVKFGVPIHLAQFIEPESTSYF